MRKRKQTNWLLDLYTDNKFYVWIVVGVIVLSGVTIGMAIGEGNSTPKLLDNSEIDIIENNVATNTEPITKQENDQEIDKISENNTKNNFNISSKNNSIEKNITKTAETQQVKNKQEINQKQSVVQEKKVELVFEMPIDGEIIKDFSQDTLVYSNTLEEWVAHTGIDILGEKAMPVKATEAGKIVEIKEDPRYGYTIIIDHGQDYQSIYCNLSTFDMVYIGKIVEKGQVISGIGETALFEIKDSPHLHFEITKNGIYIDPLKLIK